MPKPISIVLKGEYTDRDVKRAIRDLQSLQTQGGKAGKELSVAGRQIADFGGTVRKSFLGLGAGLAAGFTLGTIKDQIGQAIQAGSDLAESQSKVGAVFGTSAREINTWAQTSATKLLMGKQAALESASTFGNLFQAFGIGREQAVQMSKSLVSLSADLSSFNNLDPTVVTDKLRSGITGEQEAVKDLGIALTDQRLREEAKNLGIYKGTGVLTAHQKVLAAYNLMLKDTALAQGDVERTASGYANTTRALSAAVDNARASIGTGFLQSILAVSGSMGGPKGMVAQIESLGTGLGDVAMGAGIAVSQLTNLMKLGGGKSQDNGTFDMIGNFLKFNPWTGPIAQMIGLTADLGGNTRTLAEDMQDGTTSIKAINGAIASNIGNVDAAGATWIEWSDKVKSVQAEVGKLNAGLDHMAARSSVEAAIDAFAGADKTKTTTTKDKHGKSIKHTRTIPFLTRWNQRQHSFDLSTAAGRQGFDLASALIAATQSEAQGELGAGRPRAASRTYAYGRKSLIRELMGIGVSASEARGFARANLATPGAIPSTIRQQTTNNNRSTTTINVDARGMSPAQIAELVNRAARNAAIGTRPGMTADYMERAIRNNYAAAGAAAAAARRQTNNVESQAAIDHPASQPGYGMMP